VLYFWGGKNDVSKKLSWSFWYWVCYRKPKRIVVENIVKYLLTKLSYDYIISLNILNLGRYLNFPSLKLVNVIMEVNQFVRRTNFILSIIDRLCVVNSKVDLFCLTFLFA